MNARTRVLAGATMALLGCAGRTTPPSPPSGASPGLAAMLQDTLSAILRAGVRDSAFPGALAIVGNKDGVIVSVPVGQLDWPPSPAPDMSTLWDLASLTKVTGLTSAMMLLVETRQIELDAPLQRYVPEFRGPLKDGVTIRHVLTQIR